MLKIDKLYKNFGNKEVLKGLDLEIQDDEGIMSYT